jgi:hypothetical protein
MEKVGGDVSTNISMNDMLVERTTPDAMLKNSSVCCCKTENFTFIA